MSDNGVTVLIIRHGIAEDAAARSIADAERALTADGASRMRAGAAGIRWLRPRLDRIGHSPLRRAEETAAIIDEAFACGHRRRVDTLAPGGAADDVFAWVAEAPGGSTVAIVGHEPDLGAWIGAAVGAAVPLPLKKGAAAQVSFADLVAPGSGRLDWLLPSPGLAQLAAAR